MRIKREKKKSRKNELPYEIRTERIRRKKKRREVLRSIVEAIQNKHTYISHPLETYDFDGG